MRRHSLLFLGLVACPCVAGCSSSSSNFSCDDQATTLSGVAKPVHVCVETDGVPSDDVSSLQVSCDTQIATLVDAGTLQPSALVNGPSGTACGTANRLGTCTATAGGYTSYWSYYSDAGGLTAAQAQKDCTTQQNGTWAAN